jgi:hypothetical protein
LQKPLDNGGFFCYNGIGAQKINGTHGCVDTKKIMHKKPDPKVENFVHFDERKSGDFLKVFVDKGG